MIKKILVYSSILVLFTFIFNSLKFEENENSTNDQIEKINFESNDKLITNIATWSSSNDSLYNEIIKVEESSYLKSKKFKEKIIPPSWTYLYKKITKHDNNKLGWVPSNGLGSKFTMEWKRITQQVRAVTWMIMRSYGEKWDGSMLRVEVWSGDTLMAKKDIEGYHNKKTSETYNIKMKLDGDGVAIGKDLKVTFELVGGSTFKISGQAICDH